MNRRKTRFERTTRETRIALELDLDGEGTVDVRTDLPFFDHMLTALAFHAGWDLVLECRGDIVDVERTLIQIIDRIVEIEAIQISIHAGKKDDVIGDRDRNMAPKLYRMEGKGARFIFYIGVGRVGVAELDHAIALGQKALYALGFPSI